MGRASPVRFSVFGSIVLLVGAIVAGSVCALESDQYYAWGRDLDDSTDVINVKVRLNLDRALAEINSKPSWQRMECRQVLKRIGPQFKQFIFQDIELWASNSALVSRIPATAEEELTYRKEFLYRDTHPLDVGTKVPPSSTIEMNGVRLGTDKLSHFFSEGWWYYKWYRKSRKSGLSVEQTEERAIRHGIFWERTTLGYLSSGVFSLGDLEANFKGMQFMASLCDAEPAALQKADDGWRYAGQFDFRDYVTPEWDESYQPPVFRRGRWKKVRPVLLEYCSKLNDPKVVMRRREYQRRDTVTRTELAVQELVEAGKLKDPREFGLDHNCGETPQSIAGRTASSERLRAPR